MYFDLPLLHATASVCICILTCLLHACISLQWPITFAAHLLVSVVCDVSSLAVCSYYALYTMDSHFAGLYSDDMCYLFGFYSSSVLTF